MKKNAYLNAKRLNEAYTKRRCKHYWPQCRIKVINWNSFQQLADLIATSWGRKGGSVSAIYHRTEYSCDHDVRKS